MIRKPGRKPVSKPKVPANSNVRIETNMPISDEPVEQASAMPQVEPQPRTNRSERTRKERVPLGTPRMKLSISKSMQDYFERRNEVPRWVNDDPGRLEAASEEDTYRFVYKREFPQAYRVGEGDISSREGIDSRISRVVGTRDGGQPVIAYLMAKPKEDYEADQREKMNLVDEREAAMQQGIDAYGRPGDKERRYIPSTGIKITRT